MVAKIPGAGIGEDANATSLTLKNLATADNSTFTLNLQTAEADIAQDDVLGKINFQAPAEGTGTDANLIAASIQAVSEGDFSSSSNATKLEFMTGSSEAATSQMTISSGGIVGVGATLPGDLGVGLHIKTADSSGSANSSGDELIIENNGPAGMTILSANDNVGLIAFGDNGASNRGYLMYNHDGDVFSIGTAAGTRMTIDSAGKTGVAESTLASQFHVSAPSGFSQFIVDFDNASSSAPYGLFINYSGAAPDSGSDYQFFECRDTGTTRFVIYSDGDTYNHDNAFNQISDERIKQNITDANSQWDDIKALKVRNFILKDDARADGDKAKVQIGVVAQEAESVCPKLVTSVNPNSEHILSSAEFGTLYEDGDEIPEGKKIGDVKEIKEQVKGFRYSVLYMKAIKALQEAMTKIEALETSNTDLKNRVTALEG